MRILQVMAGGKHGGAETAFVDTCLAMHQAGLEIAVVTRKNDVRVPALQKAGVNVHTLPFGGLFDFYSKMALKKIIRKFEPDIVQTWMSRAAKKTPNWRQMKKVKPFTTVARLGGYYKLKYFKNMDYFIAISPDLKRHIEEGGVPADRVRHINNFAETEPSAKPVNREPLETPENATVVLSLARLHESKALDVLIKAVAKVDKTYLWLAGEGPARDNLTKLAEKLDIKERVKFLGWRRDRSALLQAADICSFASRVEPFGTVFAQSWANKTPVIVSDADGPKQFCRDEEDCLMVPKNDVDALAGAIKRLKEDKVLQLKLVNNGYSRYQHEFTKDKTIQAYIHFYQEMMDKRSIGTA